MLALKSFFEDEYSARRPKLAFSIFSDNGCYCLHYEGLADDVLLMQMAKAYLRGRAESLKMGIPIWDGSHDGTCFEGKL